jgi:hypothetical protein
MNGNMATLSIAEFQIQPDRRERGLRMNTWTTSKVVQGFVRIPRWVSFARTPTQYMPYDHLTLPTAPLFRQKAMLRYILLAWTITAATVAWADGALVVPHSSNADSGDISTQLLLKPCLDEKSLREMSDEPSVLKDAEVARKELPTGACNDPALVEKIFKARFLQYATLDVVSDPWSLDKIIASQDKAIQKCTDTGCMNRELDAVIAALSPIYLRPRPQWPRGKGLCTSEPADMAPSKAMTLLGRRAHTAIAAECGQEAITAQTCDGPHGRVLFTTCEMSGNQVNAPQWIYLIENGRSEPLLATEDGPVGVMESACNGLPDLVTSNRVSMGEHDMTYYRYDGRQYQVVYSKSGTAVGTDDKGNDLQIAFGETGATVMCR